MNKTTVTIGFFVLAALGIIGVVLILALRPDSVGVLVNTLVTVMGLATTAAVTFSALGKQGEKLETIAKQTNGTLSALREENARLAAENSALARQLPPF